MTRHPRTYSGAVAARENFRKEAHRIAEERDRLRAELAARPMLRVTEEQTKALVSEWLGMFDPPPQITFTQSEALQALIAALPHLGAVVPSEEAIARTIRGELTIDWREQAIEQDSIVDAARAILALFAAAPTEAAIRAEEREACAQIVDDRTRADAIRLAAGEMTAQELRTAQAVARGIASAIRSRGATP